MTFDQALERLHGWAGRDVCAAVRTPPDGSPTQVAVMRGALGAAEAERPEDGTFVPIRVSESEPLGEAVGLQLDRDEFEAASGDAQHLYLRLRGAALEVASP